MAEQEKKAHKKIKLLITIVDRGKGSKVIELCQRHYSTYHLSFMGRGTARSELLDYLGLGETEKDIIFSVVLEEQVDKVMACFEEELKIEKIGTGIAFTIPISSVGGPMTLQFLSGLYEMYYEFAKKRGEKLG